MGFVANLSNDSARIDAMGADNPITELTPDGFSLGGAARAVGTGVVGGAAAAGNALYGIYNAANKANMQGDNPEFGGMGGIGQGMLDVQAPKVEAADLSPQLEDALKKTQAWAKIDPRVSGTAEQTLGSLAHGLTVFGMGALAGGPAVAAPLLGVTEGYNDYQDSTAAGVDPQTALTKSLVTGGAAAAGAYLPMAVSKGAAKGLLTLAMGAEGGGNAALASGLYNAAEAAAKMSTSFTAKLATGAASNAAFGIVNRSMTSHVLEAAGYPDMAKQYVPLDTGALVADTIMGMAFGGVAHFTHSDAPAARPTADLVEQALDARRQDAVTRAGPGIPIDPEHSTLDGDLQDRALGNLLRGKPADITSDEASAMVEHTIADPERVQLHNDYQDANLAVHGDIADFSEPARVEAEPTPYALNDAGEPVTKPEAPEGAASVPVTGGAAISPIHSEQLNQLALRHPDMDVEGPNGNTIKARDLPQALADHATQAATESKLHDVAMACFMRTM